MAANRVMRKTVQIGPLTIRASVTPESIDPESRTADVVISTGARVLRRGWDGPFMEELSLDKKHVRLARLNNGAPLLDSHGGFFSPALSDVIGVVESGKLSDGALMGRIRFAKAEDDPKADQAFRKVRDGIIRNVSVGYRVYKFEKLEGGEEKIPVFRATDWEPFEVSLVPIGADDGAKVRSEDIQTHSCVILTRGQEKETSAMADETREQVEGQAGERPVKNPVDPGAPAESKGQAEQRQQAETERQKGIEDERKRVRGISEAVRAGGFSSKWADEMIAEGITVEEAQKRVLEAVHNRGNGARGPQGPTGARVETDPLDHVRLGITNALLHRANPEAFKLDENGRRYAHRRLVELGEYCLQARGLRTTGMSPMDIAGVALGLTIRGMHTTSDFAIILADVANKTLRRAYDEAPQTFLAISRRVPLPDFKSVKRNQLGEAPTLLEVKEHGEFTRGTIGEAKEEYALATYGRIFAITRKALVNDDTDAFSRLTMMFGRSARHLESDLVWQQITSNPNMGDGVALFHANHGNLAGVGGAIDVSTLGTGRAAMRNQKGLDGVQFLNIVPRYLAVPPGKETLADQFTTVITPAQGSQVNPFANRLTVLSEPRLEAASATAWYLAASPDQIDIIEWGVLAGEEGPVIETRVGFDVDGIEVKCRHDVAAKVIDYRGLYKNPGA